MKNTKDPTSKRVYELQYKELRNKIVTSTRKSKKDHFTQYFQENNNKLKKVWQGINSIIANKSVNNNVSSLYINDNKDISSDPISISNKLMIISLL